jgi:hypothetical protein
MANKHSPEKPEIALRAMTVIALGEAAGMAMNDSAVRTPNITASLTSRLTSPIGRRARWAFDR